MRKRWHVVITMEKFKEAFEHMREEKAEIVLIETIPNPKEVYFTNYATGEIFNVYGEAKEEVGNAHAELTDDELETMAEDGAREGIADVDAGADTGPETTGA